MSGGSVPAGYIESEERMKNVKDAVRDLQELVDGSEENRVPGMTVPVYIVIRDAVHYLKAFLREERFRSEALIEMLKLLPLRMATMENGERAPLPKSFPLLQWTAERLNNVEGRPAPPMPVVE